MDYQANQTRVLTWGTSAQAQIILLWAHLQRSSSLEKALMRGKLEGKRKEDTQHQGGQSWFEWQWLDDLRSHIGHRSSWSWLPESVLAWWHIIFNQSIDISERLYIQLKSSFLKIGSAVLAISEASRLQSLKLLFIAVESQGILQDGYC